MTYSWKGRVVSGILEATTTQQDAAKRAREQVPAHIWPAQRAFSTARGRRPSRNLSILGDVWVSETAYLVTKWLLY